MEVIHHHIKIVKRSQGRSAVAASAYRAGVKLRNERDGVTHDYSRRSGVVYADILLPENAPDSFHNRAELWNAVEKSEKAGNAQLARDIEFSLPDNLDRPSQITMILEHVRREFVDKGMCADIAIHDKNDGNPHCHLLLTMRPLDERGDFGLKSKREYILDKAGKRIPLANGDFKTRKVCLTDWDDRKNAERWHAAWATVCNRAMERLGSERRFTNQSYAEQGLSIEPTIHIGKTASQMEKRGKPSERGDINREIKERNAQRAALLKEKRELEEKISMVNELTLKIKRDGRVQTAQMRNPVNTIPPIRPKTNLQVLYTAPTHTKPVKQAPTLTLDAIKQSYVTTEIDIKQQTRSSSELRDRIRRLNANREDLTEITETIKKYDAEIARLKERQKGLSPLAAAERKRLTADIDKLTLSRDQALNYLKTEHKVSNTQGLDEKFRELDRDKNGAERQLSEITQKVDKLSEKQRTLGGDYAREYGKTAANPTREKDNRGETKRQNNQPQNLTMLERLAAAEAENRLKQRTEPEHNKQQDRERGR
jgi:hypothetical protein